jgi:hypothetical protein
LACLGIPCARAFVTFVFDFCYRLLPGKLWSEQRRRPSSETPLLRPSTRPAPMPCTWLLHTEPEILSSWPHLHLHGSIHKRLGRKNVLHVLLPSLLTTTAVVA